MRHPRSALLCASLLVVGCGDVDTLDTSPAPTCATGLGEPEPIATVAWRSFAIADGYAYYVVDAAIVRTRVTGGFYEPVFSGTAPARLRVIRGYLHWTDGDTLWRKPLSADSAPPPNLPGPPMLTAMPMLTALELGAYDVRDGNVYWAHHRSASPDEAAPSIDVHENGERIATLEGGGLSKGLFADSEALIVWNARNSDPAIVHRVVRVDADGKLTELVSRQGILDVAMVDSTLFWLGGDPDLELSGQVLAVDVGQPGEPRVVADAADLYEDDTYGVQLHTVAADDERVFYSGFLFGGSDSRPIVVAQCRDGSAASTTRIPEEPRHMAVGEDALYVSGDQLYRIPFEN